MALGGIDLNLLLVLQALLEECSVTRAAIRVGVPQPTVSNALARLRRHYRDELLVRSGNGYVLTPLARSLLPSVQESVEAQASPAARSLSVCPTGPSCCSVRRCCDGCTNWPPR
jgi:DNA-binding transcriptional LysR family regulator